MKTSVVQSISSREESKNRLIEAGVELFSKYSFEGTSTRMLAEKAGVNLASISYHFGGKEGLYIATVQRIVRQIQAKIAPGFELVNAELGKNDLSKRDCFKLICQMLETVMRTMLSSPEARFWQGIILSEQREPTGAFDLMYEQLFSPLKKTLSHLVGLILETSPTSQKVILMVATIISQVIIFRVARETLVRALNWKGYTGKEIGAILKVVLENVRSMLHLKEIPIPASSKLGGPLE